MQKFALHRSLTSGEVGAKAVQRLAALEVPKSLRRPHAVIAACVVDYASRVADSKRDKSSWAFPSELSHGTTKTPPDGDQGAGLIRSRHLVNMDALDKNLPWDFARKHPRICHSMNRAERPPSGATGR